MSLQLGETLRRDQRHSILQRDRLKGLAQSLRDYGNLTAEAGARFLEEGFRTILGIRPSRDFPSGNKMRNALSINFDSMSSSLGRAGNAALR
jgi:hypothetical protein